MNALNEVCLEVPREDRPGLLLSPYNFFPDHAWASPIVPDSLVGGPEAKMAHSWNIAHENLLLSISRWGFLHSGELYLEENPRAPDIFYGCAVLLHILDEVMTV